MLPSLRRYEPVQVPRVLLSIDTDAPRAGWQCSCPSWCEREGTWGGESVLIRLLFWKYFHHLVLDRLEGRGVCFGNGP